VLVCDELITVVPMTLWLCVVTHEAAVGPAFAMAGPDRPLGTGEGRAQQIEAHPGYVAGR